MERAMRDDEDDDIVEGPFDPDAVEVEYLEGPIKASYEVILDERHWDLAEQLAERDGISVDDAVLKAIRVQAEA